MNVNRLDGIDRENLREYVEAMEDAGLHSVSVTTSEVLGMLDDLDKVPALVDALRELVDAVADAGPGAMWTMVGDREQHIRDILDLWKGIA